MMFYELADVLSRWMWNYCRRLLNVCSVIEKLRRIGQGGRAKLCPESAAKWAKGQGSEGRFRPPDVIVLRLSLMDSELYWGLFFFPPDNIFDLLWNSFIPCSHEIWLCWIINECLSKWMSNFKVVDVCQNGCSITK